MSPAIKIKPKKPKKKPIPRPKKCPWGYREEIEEGIEITQNKKKHGGNK